MTRNFLASSAILVGLMGAGPAAAQDGAIALPPLLADLGLERVDVDTEEHGGREYEGWLPDGVEIEAVFDASGNLVEIEADDGALPASVIEAVLPQAVRDSEIMAQFGTIDEIKTRDGRFGISGEDGNGADMRALFDEAGNVLRFGRDDDDRGRDRKRHHREDGPGRDGNARATPAPVVDTVAINQRLTEAGYDSFGLLRQEGPRLLLDATNPDGETVTLELDRQGEVVRETAR